MDWKVEKGIPRRQSEQSPGCTGEAIWMNSEKVELKSHLEQKPQHLAWSTGVLSSLSVSVYPSLFLHTHNTEERAQGAQEILFKLSEKKAQLLLVRQMVVPEMLEVCAGMYCVAVFSWAPSAASRFTENNSFASSLQIASMPSIVSILPVRIKNSWRAPSLEGLWEVRILLLTWWRTRHPARESSPGPYHQS